jgi:hypothetical protein
MKVFISYAREDEKTAARLYADLQRTGAEPWLDRESLLPGKDWERAIRKAIKGSSFFLALISENSVGKRGYVQKELRTALEYLDEFPPDSIYVIPVRLDDTEPQHERLAKLHWVDLFLSYEEGLAKICASLGLDAPEKVRNEGDQPPVSAPRAKEGIPDDVLNVMREEARADYPDDFSTQRYVIQNQTRAWHQLQEFSPEGIPDEISENILNLAQDQHPNDFSTQIYVARNQANAWHQLQRLNSDDVPDDVFQRIKENAAADHPGDYSTQVYVIKSQLNSWKQINS